MNKYFIDTSIWIDYLNNDIDNNLQKKIQKYIIDNDIYFNGIIIAEIISGCKNNKEREQIKYMFSGLNFIELLFDDYLKIGEYNSNLLNKGIKIPMSDLIIFYCTYKNKLKLITKDKHFKMIKNIINFDLMYID